MDKKELLRKLEAASDYAQKTNTSLVKIPFYIADELIKNLKSDIINDNNLEGEKQC